MGTVLSEILFPFQTVQEGLCDFPVEERDQRPHKEGGYDRSDVHLSENIDTSDSAEHSAQTYADQVTDDPAVLKRNTLLLFTLPLISVFQHMTPSL